MKPNRHSLSKRLKLLSLFVLVVGTISAQSNLTFTVNNLSGFTQITCTSTPYVHLTASSSYTTGTVTYVWSNGTYSTSGSNVLLSNAGNYTITATASPNLSAFKTMAITINTIAPNSSASPSVQNVSCISPTANVVVLISPTPTIATNPPPVYVQNIVSPNGGTVVLNNQSSFLYQTTGGIGTYTYMITNITNGCKTTNLFALTATASGFPTFSITSPQNFTLGCNTKSVASVFINNANTTPAPGGPVTYTLLSPGSANTNSTGILSSTSVYTVNSAGTYTAITRDNISLCETRVPFTVSLNGINPNLSVVVPTQILDCNNPSVVLNGNSTNPNAVFNWSYPGTPGTSANDTIVVQSNSAAPTLTFIANYTLTVTDLNSTCTSNTIIPMYQNLFKPNAHISSGFSNALTCLTPSIMLTNTSISGIPLSSGFPVNQAVVGQTWMGPTPLVPLNLSSLYVASLPGTYTMIAKDLNNGCTSFTTISIMDNRIYPVVNNPVSPSPFCISAAGSATIVPIITVPSSALSYSWTIPANAVVSGANTAVLTTNMIGMYTIIVTNTINGCITLSQMSVIDCSLISGINTNSGKNIEMTVFPNPGNGIYEIKFNAANTVTYRYEVLNSLGEVIKKDALNSDNTIINLQTSANGIYFIRFVENDQTIKTLKLIKQ